MSFQAAFVGARPRGTLALRQALRVMSSDAGDASSMATEAATVACGASDDGSGGSGAKRQRLLAPALSSRQHGKGRQGKSAAEKRNNYKEPGPGIIALPGGTRLDYQPNLLPAAEADALFRTLRNELPWEQRSVRVMGRVVAQPRLIAYQADGPELGYTYSGTTLVPAPWHPAVAALKARAEAAAGTTFNCCLLNLYRSGADSIAWHSDNERLFGERPTIASVSLGAAREFLLRRIADTADKYRFRLGGGALLVMGPGVQEEWMHSVPRRTSAPPGERISLTFRTIIAPERGCAQVAGRRAGTSS